MHAHCLAEKHSVCSETAPNNSTSTLIQSCLADGQTTGYGSSQVEQDRTGGKPQTGPKPTEHGTVRRPGIPSREDSAGRDPDKTRPRTGTTGGDPNEMMYGPAGSAIACASSA